RSCRRSTTTRTSARTAILTRLRLTPVGSAVIDRECGHAVLAEVKTRKFRARCDAEFGEHLAQVVLDRSRAEKQLGGHVRVAHSGGDQASDLQLLRCELVPRRWFAPACGLAASAQL